MRNRATTSITRVDKGGYQAVVYHGGTLLGLGRWATGRVWQERARAEREGARLAAEARRVVGGDPIVVIEGQGRPVRPDPTLSGRLRS